MLPTDHEAPSPTLSPDSDELEQIGRSYLGHRVSAYWGGDRCWYSGTIIGEAGDVLNVRYDDQEEGEVHIGTDIFVVDRSGSGPGASDSKSRRRRKSWTAAFTRMFSAGARKDKRKKIHTEGMEPASSAPSTAREPEVQPLPCSTPLARCASEPSVLAQFKPRTDATAHSQAAYGAYNVVYTVQQPTAQVSATQAWSHDYSEAGGETPHQATANTQGSEYESDCQQLQQQDMIQPGFTVGSTEQYYPAHNAQQYAAHEYSAPAHETEVPDNGGYYEEEKEEEKAEYETEYSEAGAAQQHWDQPNDPTRHDSDYAWAEEWYQQQQSTENSGDSGDTSSGDTRHDVAAHAGSAASCLVSPGAYSPANYKRFGTFWNSQGTVSEDEGEGAIATTGAYDDWATDQHQPSTADPEPHSWAGQKAVRAQSSCQAQAYQDHAVYGPSPGRAMLHARSAIITL